MKRMLSTCAGALIFLGAACSPAAPTADPAQIQASAVAAANTMVAMTQAAIPTATEAPPTPIPSPTPPPTPMELPTLAFQAPTVAPTQSAALDCNHLFDLGATGNAKSPVKINNNNKASLNLSLGMFQKNAFGQCGYLSFSIQSNSSVTVSMPQTGQGPCWWGYGWVNGKNPSTPEGGPFCWNNTDKWTLDVGADSIKLTAP